MAMTNLKSSLRYFMGFCLFLFRVLLFSCIPLLFSWKPSTRKTRLERGSIQSSGKSERDRRWKRTRVNNGKQNSHVMFELCVYVICVSIYFHYIHSYLLKPSCCRRCGLLFWWLATRKQCYSFRSFHSLSLFYSLILLYFGFIFRFGSFFFYSSWIYVWCMFSLCFWCLCLFVIFNFLSSEKQYQRTSVRKRERARAQQKQRRRKTEEEVTIYRLRATLNSTFHIRWLCFGKRFYVLVPLIGIYDVIFNILFSIFMSFIRFGLGVTTTVFDLLHGIIYSLV